MRSVIVGLLITAVPVGHASAIELRAAESRPNWDGFHLAVQGSFAGGFVEELDDSVEVTGALGGLAAGYDWQKGRLIFGVEADISAGSISGTDQVSGSIQTLASPDPAPFDVETDVDVDWLATVRGRVGVSGDRWLIYATGGVAAAEVSSTGDLSSPGVSVIPDFDSVTGGSNTHKGWTLGAGVEAAITERWSAKLEYLYVDLNEETFRNDVTVPTVGVHQVTTTVNPDLHVVRAGLSYRF